ncbi:hypothetical protein GCM10027176_72730 [Actinoallomurus bryophytorum]
MRLGSPDPPSRDLRSCGSGETITGAFTPADHPNLKIASARKRDDLRHLLEIYAPELVDLFSATVNQRRDHISVVLDDLRRVSRESAKDTAGDGSSREDPRETGGLGLLAGHRLRGVDRIHSPNLSAGEVGTFKAGGQRRAVLQPPSRVNDDPCTYAASSLAR